MTRQQAQPSLLFGEGENNDLKRQSCGAREPISRAAPEAEPSGPKARPILFSAPMVRALLAGTKTHA